MTEITAEALAKHYVSLVGDDMDVTAANEWANTLTEVDEDIRREAAELAAKMLNEQEAQVKEEKAVEAPVEPSDEAVTETTTDVQGEDNPSENA